MEHNAKIYVAGHRGLVGSALMRNLQAKCHANLLTRTHAELDLADQAQVEAFFAREKPDYVFEDIADACVYLMKLPDTQFNTLLSNGEAKIGTFIPPLVNLDVREDLTIRELAEMVKVVVDDPGEIVFDASKPGVLPASCWKYHVYMPSGGTQLGVWRRECQRSMLITLSASATTSFLIR